MIRPLTLFLSLLFLLVAQQLCQAQLTELPSLSTSPAASPAKIDPATEKKALDLLESVSEQVVNLHSSGNRMRAECAVADLLWARDEKRARSLFTAAVAQLVSRVNDLDYSDQDVYQEITQINQTRQELILRIAAHDPELAITALRQTRVPTGNNARVNWSFQNEANLELNVANLIAAKDPVAALRLARSSLSQGVSWNVIAFLSQLYRKDPKSAQTLYQEIVARVKDDNIARSPDLANNAWNLLVSFQPPQADEETYHDLLTTTLGYVLNADRRTQTGITMAQNFYYQLERMMPLVEKYAPARAIELREWSQTVERTLDPQVKMYQDLHKVSESGSVDDMLALASKYPPEFQHLLYQNAAWKALSDGNPQRAKEIIDMIPDPVQRRQMNDQIDNQLANAAAAENKLAEARRLVEKAKTLNRKIEILIQMANALVAGNDKKTALELLNEGQTIVTSASQSADQLNARLRLAQAYLRLDPDQAFSMLEPLIAKVNELVSAAAALDGIDFHYLRDGEWQMPGVGNIGSVVNSLDQTLATLGRTDFDRARTLADQLERPELRVLMEIDLAQVTLGGKIMSNQPFGGRIISGGNMIVN